MARDPKQPRPASTPDPDDGTAQPPAVPRWPGFLRDPLNPADRNRPSNPDPQTTPDRKQPPPMTEASAPPPYRDGPGFFRDPLNPRPQATPDRKQPQTTSNPRPQATPAPMTRWPGVFRASAPPPSRDGPGFFRDL
nr:proline-rich receptor-like protein kinase PERK2 [Penaeus vannamei]